MRYAMNLGLSAFGEGQVGMNYKQFLKALSILTSTLVIKWNMIFKALCLKDKNRTLLLGYCCISFYLSSNCISWSVIARQFKFTGDVFLISI